MICPSCGCSNKADDIYCDECGAQLKASRPSERRNGSQNQASRLAEGQAWDRFTVLSILQSDSSCVFYELCASSAAGVNSAGEGAAAGSAASEAGLPASGTPDSAAVPDELQSENGESCSPQADSAAEDGADKGSLLAEGAMLCEFPSNPGRAVEIFGLLQAVRSEYMWPLLELRDTDSDMPKLLGPKAGIPLREYLKNHMLEYADMVRIGCDVLNGLKVFHNMCQLFNGVSLDSVWITPEGHAVLARYDRVVPKFQTGDASVCSVLEGFSAPEAYGLEGGELSRRSDIYSAGALLFFLLTGRLADMRDESRNSFPAAIRMKAKQLTKVIAKALKRRPEERWLSASEMAEALQDSLSVQASDAAPQAADISSADAPEQPAEAGEASGNGYRTDGRITSSSFGSYTAAKRTNVGMVRKINQDAFLELTLSVCERDVPTTVHFIGVIDGMGGEAEGDKAASLAARTIASELVSMFLPLKNESATSVLMPEDSKERSAFALERAIKKANQTIYDYACKSPARRGMGCTISCALFCGDDVTFGHVGDTRGYRFCGDMDQVTTDHSIVGQLVQMGTLTREEARHSPKRSLIYRALGTQPSVEVDVYQRTLASGEYVMLSSDGVWEYYSDEELLEYFRQDLTPVQICCRLVDTCLERGADDNTTVAVIRHN